MIELEEIAEAIISIENKEDIEKLFKELFTESELSKLVLRWALLKQLAAGKSQRDVASELGISLCKITRGAKYLKDDKSLLHNIFLNKK